MRVVCEAMRVVCKAMRVVCKAMRVINIIFGTSSAMRVFLEAMRVEHCSRCCPHIHSSFAAHLAAKTNHIRRVFIQGCCSMIVIGMMYFELLMIAVGMIAIGMIAIGMM